MRVSSGQFFHELLSLLVREDSLLVRCKTEILRPEGSDADSDKI